MNSVGRSDGFTNFNPNKRSPANFSILVHIAGHKMKGELCLRSAVGTSGDILY